MVRLGKAIHKVSVLASIIDLHQTFDAVGWAEDRCQRDTGPSTGQRNLSDG
jgi:hypothetical protein